MNIESLEPRRMLYVADLGPVFRSSESAMLDGKIYTAGSDDRPILTVNDGTEAGRSSIDLGMRDSYSEVSISELERVGKRVLFTIASRGGNGYLHFVGSTDGKTIRYQNAGAFGLSGMKLKVLGGQPLLTSGYDIALLNRDGRGLRPVSMPDTRFTYSVSDFVEQDGSIFFIRSIPKRSSTVFRIDDLNAATPVAVDTGISAQSLTSVGGKVVMATDAVDNPTGYAQWFWNANAAPTEIPNLRASLRPVEMNNRIWFAGADGFWSSDGTIGGTRFEWKPAGDASKSMIRSLHVTDKRLVYHTAPNQIWSAGTEPGSALLLYERSNLYDFSINSQAPNGDLIVKNGSGFATSWIRTDGLTLTPLPDSDNREKFVGFAEFGTLYDHHGQLIVSRNVNRPPIAVVKPVTFREGDSVTFDASDTSDPDRDRIRYYDWDLNHDGDYTDKRTYEPYLKLTWKQLASFGIVDGPRTYQVSVRANDGELEGYSAPATVTVTGIPPQVKVTSATGASVTGLEALVYIQIKRVGTESILSTTIDWGDGSPIESISGSAIGHRYQKAARYTVAVRVESSEGTTIAKTKVQVTDKPNVPRSGFQELPFYSAFKPPVSVNGLDYYIGIERDLPYDFYVSDGTVAGTRGLDVFSSITDVYALNNRALLFGFTRPASNKYSTPGHFQLFTSDGTLSGTTLLMDIRNEKTPTVTIAGGWAFFVHQGDLWVTDGTPAGTRAAGVPKPTEQQFDLSRALLLKDGAVWIDQYRFDGTTFSLAPQMPWYTTTQLADGRHAWLDAYGDKLYATDGTLGGTVTLTESEFDPYVYFNATANTAGRADGLFILGSNIDFVSNDGETTRIRTFSNDDKHIGSHRGFHYFLANDKRGDPQIYRTDGTIDGTWRLTSVRGGVASSHHYAMLYAAGKQAYIAIGGYDESIDVIYRTNGTSEQTAPVVRFTADEKAKITGVIGSTLYYERRKSLTSTFYSTQGTRSTTHRLFELPNYPAIWTTTTTQGDLIVRVGSVWSYGERDRYIIHTWRP